MKSILSVLVGLLISATPCLAQTVDLGEAAAFSLIAGASLRNEGATVVTGSLAVKGLFLGWPPGIFTGINDTTSRALLDDIQAAQEAITAMTPTGTLNVSVGGGQTLTPGIYTFGTLKSGTLFGDLTLDGAGTYIFQVEDVLTIATDTVMKLTHGAVAENVWWNVFQNVNIESGADVKGSIMAASSIFMGLGSAINGGMYSGADVSLDANKIGLVD